jgi:hypothetical protein
MFRPVGSQPSSIYWRRRLLLVASVIALVVLVLLTVHAVFSGDSGGAGGGGNPAAAGTSSDGSASPSTTPNPSPSIPPSRTASSKQRTSPSPSRSTSVAPKPCPASSLALGAVTDAPSYTVGAEPVLSLQVTNTRSVPCVVDLADPQIVLRIYNGESRVWGSHDCRIEPGTDDRTLMAGASVKVSVVWSGLSSQPQCAGQRERVGAGTYTLYASLAGHEGKAAQFTLR